MSAMLPSPSLVPVFISYAGDDLAVATDVRDLLEHSGITCWMAPRDVSPGAVWDEAILDAIAAAPAVLLLLSSHANSSLFVKNEINTAFAQGKPIVTFRLEDVFPGRSLQLYLATHHWTDAFPPPFAERVARVATAIRALLDEAGPAAPSLQAAPVTAQPERPAVAVLAFADMSPGQDHEYLCDGIAEELIAELGTADGIDVISRTSSFRFKGRSADIRDIGRELRATAVLEGSVRVSGPRLRVTVQLTTPSDGRQLWSQRFDRGFDDLFAVQDEIAREVARHVQGRLLTPVHPVAVEAFTAYLKGRHHWNRRTEPSLRASLPYFAEALEHDAHYAQAHAATGDAYLMLAVQGAEPPETAMPRARAAAERALAIRPLAEAHAVLACVHAFYDWQWLEAESGFLRALALAPSYASAHQWYAMNCLLPLGRTAEAMSNLEAALRYEPLSLAIQTSIGIAHYFAGRWADALAAFAHALQLDAGFALAHSFVGQTLVELEQHSAAIRSLEHAVALAGRSPETLGALGYALGRSGEVARAHDIDGELERLSGSRHVAASHRAHLRAGLGDADAAIRLLGDAVAARAPDVIWTHLRPAYKPLAAHRGYEATLRPLALPGPAAGPGEPAVQPGAAELG